MRVPVSWLKELVETELSAEELAERLTLGGLEVEGVEEAYQALGPVVAAEILEVKAHPEADRLAVCELSDGKRRYTVVSGAPGLKPGLKVALALPGAVTFSGAKVQETRLRGVPSEGLLLSPYEAGVSEEKNRLLILPPEAEPGFPFHEALGLSEPVLEVAVTPNRGDCLSILGVAREVSALTGAPLKFPEIPAFPEGDLREYLECAIEDEEGCFRYAGRLLEGLSVGESPFWMAQRLWMCGLRPLNNLVDVTNYVMLELGQPLHAFDYERIRGKRILVRAAREGEGLRTLDGQWRELPTGTLVIADAEGPVAVAGVMGGEESGVREETRRVFLESAWFNPVRIRRSARSLRLSTESSYRFERGVDPEGVPRALDRAAALLVEVAGGRILPGKIDLYPRPWKAPEIRLRRTKLISYLRWERPFSEAGAYLKRLGGEVQVGEEELLFRPPSHRGDLVLEEDLIEEVARLYGYDRLPVTLPVGELSARPLEREDRVLSRVREALTALGFYEVINYSFIDPRALEVLELPEGDPRLRPLRLANPLSETQSVMRTTLLPGLLETARFNFFREVGRLRIFEVGRVFFPGEGELPEERLHLGLLVLGLFEPPFWGGRGRPADIYDLKGVLETLFESLGLSGLTLKPQSREVFLRRGLSFRLLAGEQEIGYAGEVKNYLRAQYELPAPLLVAEMDLTACLALPELPRRYQGLPRFPATSRDLSLVLREEVPAGEVLQFLTGLDIPYLEKVEVVDVYRGEPLAAGEKSVTIRFVYRAPERTLTDEEVNALQEEVAAKVLSAFGGRRR
ncbi:phenylalanine--tRNA ligase subunit beta [Thermosulfurimonas marina]|uniref:Phenylalanine--tRNA ligase beta subunit n=1 Tax=Thermosulfurimonas marina TaxID=2047767 RepID=A0A6H1WUD4_9BACT|nr:phenylalanine--tRNA ligase subunit beta [Thermosulfurimonas marina]QJA06798.1 phenylalanine--tRNA ligase subunit beta [Thermosulfurimonas marina]